VKTITAFLFGARKPAAGAFRCLLLLAMWCAPVWAGAPAASSRAQQAAALLDDGLALLATCDLPDPDALKTLPPAWGHLLTAVHAAALTPGGSGDRRAALVNALGANCAQLFSYTLIAVVIDIFDILPFDRLIVQVLAAATLLCYLGVI